jgi:hypothetical protein
MADTSLDKLKEAGYPVEEASDEQREVLSSLSSDEVETLARITGKLKDATGTGEDSGIFYH